MSHAASQLHSISLKAEHQNVEYMPEWANHTGYLDYLVSWDFPDIKFGERFTGNDNFGRLFVGVKTRFGNVVLFRRYSGDDNTHGVVVSNVPDELRTIIPSGSLDSSQILSALGYFSFDNNIGKLIEIAYALGVSDASGNKAEE